MSFNPINCTIIAGKHYLSSSGSFQPLKIENKTVGSLSSTTDISLHTAFVYGSIHTEGSLKAFYSKISDRIDITGSMHLEHVHCESINGGGGLTALYSNIKGRVNLYGDVIIDNRTSCEGKIKTTGPIAVTNHSKVSSLETTDGIFLSDSESDYTQSLFAKGSIIASRCLNLGNLNAQGFVQVNECPCISSILTQDQAVVRDSHVKGNVTSEAGAHIINSTIEGILNCSSKGMLVENSTIDTLYVRCDQSLFLLELKNCTIKNVIFEGGEGKITLIHNSCILHNITRGKISA